MRIEDIVNDENININGINSTYYLLGLLSAFQNRFQTMADNQMKEISWKQFFLIICMNMCKEDPTIKELAQIVGSSHQNVKQLLIKLENKGFVELYKDNIQSSSTIKFNIFGKDVNNNSLKLTFDLPDAISPLESGIGRDSRILALQIHKIVINKIIQQN